MADKIGATVRHKNSNSILKILIIDKYPKLMYDLQRKEIGLTHLDAVAGSEQGLRPSCSNLLRGSKRAKQQRNAPKVEVLRKFLFV